MSSVNKAILIGNMGQDPTVNETKSGSKVANFSLATSFKPADGEEKTEWHRVVVFGKLAELVEAYTAKGMKLYVEGRLQTRSYENKEGNTQYTTEIVAERIQFLSKKEGEEPVKADKTSKTKTKAGKAAKDAAPADDDFGF